MIGLPFLTPDDHPPCMDAPTLFDDDYDITGPARDDRTDYAKQKCGRCPFQAECLDWGLKHEKHGIWGGTTGRQRETMRDRNKIRLRQPRSYQGSGDWVETARRESERRQRSLLVGDAARRGVIVAYNQRMSEERRREVSG